MLGQGTGKIFQEEGAKGSAEMVTRGGHPPAAQLKSLNNRWGYMGHRDEMGRGRNWKQNSSSTPGWVHVSFD